MQEVLGDATIVIGRFHVARHYRDAVDELRKQEVRRLKKELPKDAADDLKRTLWPFRKRAADLDDGEQERLDALLAYSPALRQAYTLREELFAEQDSMGKYCCEEVRREPPSNIGPFAKSSASECGVFCDGFCCRDGKALLVLAYQDTRRPCQCQVDATSRDWQWPYRTPHPRSRRSGCPAGPGPHRRRRQTCGP